MNKKTKTKAESKEIKKVAHVDTQLSSKAHENIAPKTDEAKENESVTAKENSKKKRYPDVFGGLIFITLGVVLLLNNFGLLPWNIWSNIWRFWPIFIIIGGVNMLFKNSWWKTIVMFIITAILLAGVLVYSLVNSNVYNFGKYGDWMKLKSNRNSETYRKFILDSAEYKDIEERKITLKNDVGTIKILETSETDKPFTVYGWYHDNLVTPNFEHSLKNGKLSILFDAKINSGWFNFWNSEDNIFKVELGKTDIPTDLDIQITSGKAEIYLDENVHENITTKLTSGNLEIDIDKEAYVAKLLKVDITSGNSKLNLKNVKQLPEVIEIKATTGDTKIYLPSDVEMVLEYEVTSGSVKVDENRLQGKGTYKTDNGDMVVFIKVKVISGNVEIIM